MALIDQFETDLRDTNDVDVGWIAVGVQWGRQLRMPSLVIEAESAAILDL